MTDEERRKEALKQAVTLHGMSVTTKPDSVPASPHKVINTAQLFETYLNGELSK